MFASVTPASLGQIFLSRDFSSIVWVWLGTLEPPPHTSLSAFIFLKPLLQMKIPQKRNVSGMKVFTQLPSVLCSGF